MERTSSRLIKREEKKLAKQTILAVVGAAALLLIFIFVILPIFINLVNNYLGTNPFPETDSVVLQAPLVDAPPPATKDRELTLTGYSPAGSEVVLVVNGVQSTSVEPNEERRFEMKLNLSGGTNTLAVFAKDGSNESPTSREYTVVYDAAPPVLVIDSPKDGDSVDPRTETITFEGQTDQGAKVTVNDRIATMRADGSWRITVGVTTGENEFTIKSVDEAGNSAESKLKVTRRED